MTNVIDQVSAARGLYADALREAQNTINGLFKQSGFNFGGTNFDPQAVINMTPAEKAAMIANTQETSTGAAADTRSAGATEEANAVTNAISRNIMGGGLANYARSSIEGKTTSNVGKIREAFMSDVLSNTGKVGTAYDVMQQTLNDINRASTETTSEQYASNPYSTTTPQGNTSPYSTKGTPGGNFPKAPRGGQMWTGPGGANWQYRINGPSGKGWYKK
jgi:hypothetical protein